MNETKKRIAEYKKKLPKLKEKVLATALLVVLAFAMATTSTFAWLVLSRAPEVTGATTALAANGNLEIALVGPNGDLPLESAIGDGQRPIAERNLTWGNLVNLSDESYGLQHLVLRPAQLNLSSLLTSPLYGAVYTPDGRMEKLNSNFAYAVWDQTGERFFVKDEYGVRAISSTTVEAVGFAQQVFERRAMAEEANLKAGSMYTEIMQKEAWMNSLATVMGTYMTAKMNAAQGDASLTNPTLNSSDVVNLRDIFGAFVDIYEQMFEAEAQLLNYQLFLMNSSEEGNTPFTPYTAAMVKEATEASLNKAGLQASGLDQMKADYPKLVSGYEDLVLLAQSGTVKWEDSGINDIVNNLMNVGKCTLDGTPVNNIGVSNAFDYLDSEIHSAVITNGVLYEFEMVNGTYCEVKNLKVSAKVKRNGITVPASISVAITTSAKAPALFVTDLEYADTLNKGAKGTEIAEDTYGLAVDFWVRTNAVGSYLLLEGNVLTKTEEVDVTGKDANGNTVNIYTLTRSTEDNGETLSYTIDLYQKDSTWYNATTHEVVTLENGEAPIQKKETVTTVIGYEGENRVWDDSMLSVDATTQGSGSCYVYYADTPEDQARSLRLLEAFCVVFIDDKGNKLATAEMDTEHFFAENGRVTVPLVLSSTDAIDIGTDINGTTQYAITSLEQNVPKRVTAVIYLDGTKLTNNDVLAAADIQGQLNIQFGSSVELNSLKDEALSNKERYVSASVSKSKFDYDTATEPMTTTVTVTVTGDQPTTMTGFFLRKINNSQGSREETMEFTQDASGAWVAEYTFKYPGNYILRSVELDGVEYDLKIPEGGDYPTVEVTGFTISQLRVDSADSSKHINIMTANNTSSVDVTLAFATNDPTKMPSTVSGRFLRDDGAAANIIFTYNPNQGVWKGDATFLTSGEYTLQYLVLDGEYTELDPSLWHTATVYLGMKVAVYTSSPLSFKYLPSEMADNEKNLQMQVRIMDNTGEPMIGLTGVELQYMMEGSTITEEGMNAGLLWNAVTGYYEGEFDSKVGMFEFGYVSVGGDMITNDTISPRFEINSPEPPTFERGDTVAYQFISDGKAATLAIILKNCPAAQMEADVLKDGASYSMPLSGRLASRILLTDEDGNDYYEYKWVFDIPNTTETANNDGVWKINTVRIWNVYDEDGNRYTQDSPLVFDLTNEDKVTANYVTKVKVAMTPMANNQLGTDDKGNVTANFMDTHTISGLQLVISDNNNNIIQDVSGNYLVSNVKLTYTYNGGSETYGFYKPQNTTLNGTVLGTIEFETTDGKTFTQKGTLPVQYAGEYTAVLTYTAGTTTVTVDVTDVWGFTVHSNKPTVKVTGVSPDSSTSLTLYSGSMANGGGSVMYNQNVNGYNSYTDYYACVYIYATSNYRYTSNLPKVKLQISGMPNSGFDASMTFSTNASQGESAVYQFTANNQEVEKNIGYDEDGFTLVVEDVQPKIYPIGKQTVTQMTVVYGGITYTVDLSHEVTINQPQYPPYADIKINDSTFTGTLPSRVYSQDGETITVTLPGSQTWTTNESNTVNGEFVVQSGYPSTRTVYGTWTEGGFFGIGATRYYNGYTETTTVSKATSSTTTWVNTRTITGWKVGNTVYAPGTTVTLTGNQTITAVVTITEGTKTTASSTTTRTEITYTKTASKVKSNPGGTDIGIGSSEPKNSTTDTVS